MVVNVIMQYIKPAPFAQELASKQSCRYVH